MDRPKRILCVDDEPDMRMVLERALALTLEAEVATAGSAEEAFDYLEKHPPPDVILLDGVMPGIDGFQACERLAADPRYRTIPIVFLSARSDDRDRERARAVGATACLAKPFDPMTIGDEICAALEHRPDP